MDDLTLSRLARGTLCLEGMEDAAIRGLFSDLARFVQLGPDRDPIEFNDDVGRPRKLVWEYGEPAVGLQAGYELEPLSTPNDQPLDVMKLRNNEYMRWYLTHLSERPAMWLRSDERLIEAKRGSMSKHMLEALKAIRMILAEREPPKAVDEKPVDSPAPV